MAAGGTMPPMAKDLRFDAVFNHTHVSGLWDAPRERWLVLLKSVFRDSDVVTVTEFTQSPIGEWLPEGWAKIHVDGAGRNECAIFYRLDTWAPVERWCIPISKTPYALGSGKVRPRVHLLGAALRHVKSGRVVNFEVFHTPSAIEGKNGLIRLVRRSKAMLECLSAISLHRRADLKGEPVVLAADWNLNLKLVWVQAFLRARLRRLRSAWKRPLPDDGSHGKRLIDGIRISKHLRAIGRGSRLRSLIRPFDHRSVTTVLGLLAHER